MKESISKRWEGIGPGKSNFNDFSRIIIDKKNENEFIKRHPHKKSKKTSIYQNELVSRYTYTVKWIAASLWNIQSISKWNKQFKILKKNLFMILTLTK